MSGPSPAVPWKVYRFGLLVTGKGESLFLDRLFRSLCERMAQTGRGVCEFRVLAKIEQLTPRTSAKRPLSMPGQRGRIPTRDEDVALRALGFLRQGGDFVLLIDDLEGARRSQVAAVYSRYREAFNQVLPDHYRWRTSVHFLVNMLEAYYFADAKAINAVMGSDWTDYEGDVETIGHPKGELKRQLGSFDEVKQGEQIVRHLDVPHVLSRPETCAALRTLFAWCWRALRLSPGEDYQLEKGCYFEVTRSQIEQLPSVNG
ncbi:MAG: DUF4276 family protein [Gemmataceae bacterium]